jgi:hypothetical protein
LKRSRGLWTDSLRVDCMAPWWCHGGSCQSDWLNAPLRRRSPRKVRSLSPRVPVAVGASSGRRAHDRFRNRRHQYPRGGRSRPSPLRLCSQHPGFSDQIHLRKPGRGQRRLPAMVRGQDGSGGIDRVAALPIVAILGHDAPSFFSEIGLSMGICRRSPRSPAHGTLLPEFRTRKRPRSGSGDRLVLLVPAGYLDDHRE